MSRQDAKHAKKLFGEPPLEADAIARRVIGAAIEVHRHLGPGFLELVYEEALASSRIASLRAAPRELGAGPSQHSLRAATARRDCI